MPMPQRQHVPISTLAAARLAGSGASSYTALAVSTTKLGTTQRSGREATASSALHPALGSGGRGA